MSFEIHFEGQVFQLDNPRLPNLVKFQEYVSKNLPIQLPRIWVFESLLNPNDQNKHFDEEKYKVSTRSLEEKVNSDPIKLKIVIPSYHQFQEFNHDERSHLDSEEAKHDFFRLEKNSGPKMMSNYKNYIINSFSESSTLKEKSQIHHLPEVQEDTFEIISEPFELKEENIKIYEKQFKDGLKERDLEDIKELKEKIDGKKKKCEKYKSEDKQNKLAKAQQKLKELQDLESVFLKMESLQGIIEDNSFRIAELKKEFNDGLKEDDLEGIEEVREKIEKKKKECEEFKSANKQNKLAKAQLKMQKLQYLEILFAKIESLNRPFVRDLQLAESPKGSNECLKEQAKYSAEEEQIQRFNEKRGRLESLWNRVASMPDCAQRTLLRLILYSDLVTIKQELRCSLALDIPDDLEDEITKIFKDFKRRQVIEGNNDAKINETISACIMDIDFKNFESLQINLNIIKRELVPFDIQEMLELVKGSEDSLCTIEDKDICMFIGDSGAGKSVTAHYVVGSKMVKVEINGKDHFEPSDVTNPILQKIVASSASKSETKIITAVKVDVSKYGLESNHLWICDTPGLLDTQGAEVDVANGFNMKKALRQCKSVRIIFFVSYLGLGDRCQEFKKIAQTLVGMIPDINTYSRSIAYFFTKFPDNKADYIYGTLKEILESLTDAEKFDNKLPRLLKDMMKKTKQCPIVINPLDGKPEEILEEISSLDGLQRASDRFKFPINPESRMKLENQAYKHQINIISAAKRFEYLLAQYLLNELKVVCDLLDLEYLKRIHLECSTSLIRHLVDQYNSAKTAISKCLSEGNLLSQREIEQFKASIRNAELAEPLRKDLGDEAVGSSSYILIIKTQVDDMLVAIDNKNIDDPLIRSTLDKIHLLKDNFDDFNAKYQNVCEKVLNLFQTSIKDFSILFEKCQYEQSGLTLTQIQKAISLYENHLEKDRVQSHYQEAKNSIVVQLKDSVNNLEPIFTQPEIKGKDIDNIQISLEKLDKIKDSSSLRAHISQNNIQNLSDGLVNLAFNYYKKVEEKVTQLIENKKEKSLANVETLIEQLVLLRKISRLENKTSDTYHNLFLTLSTSLLALKGEALNETAKIFQSNPSSNVQNTYENLCKILIKLKSASWISKYKENVQIDIMESIHEEISEQTRNLKMYLADIPIDLDHPEALKEAYQKVRILTQMISLEKIFPDLNQARGEVLSFLEGRVINFFNEHKEQIPNYSKLQDFKFNAKKIDKVFAYCEKAKEIPELKAKCLDLLEKLERVIQVCSSEIIQQMGKHYKDILEFMENFSNREFPVRNHIIFNGSPRSPDGANDSNCLDDNLSCISDSSSAKGKSIRKYISGKSEFITRNLDVIYKIREYETIYKLFDPSQEILKNWERKIQDLAIEIEEKLKLSLSNESHLNLYSFIEVTKGLSELDEFHHVGENEKFKKIAKTYYDHLLQDSHEKVKEVGNQIKDHKFDEEVKKHLDEFAKQSNDLLFGPRYKRLTSVLSITIQDLRDEILKKAESIFSKGYKNNIQEFNRDLLKHEKAKSTVASHIENEKVRENLNNLKAEVQQKISKSLLTHFNKLLESIENNEFLDELEDKIDLIKDACRNLEGYYDEQILENLNLLETTEKRKLAELQEKFSNMDIKSYSSFSPKFLLEKLSTKTHDKYRQLKEAIENKVKEAIKKELPRQDENQPIETVQRQIRNLEYSLNFVPDNIKIEIQEELMGYRKSLDKKETELSTEFTNLVQNPEPNQYALIIKKCQEIGEEMTLSRVKSHLHQEISNLKRAIGDKLENKQIEEIKPSLVRFIELQNSLHGLTSDFEGHSIEIEAVVLTSFKREFNSLMTKFQFLDHSIDAEMGLSNLKNLLAFGRLQTKLKNHLTYSHHPHNILIRLSEESTSIFSRLSEVMTRNLLRLKDEYDNALPNLNIHILVNSLKLKEKWEPLVTLVRSVDEEFHNEFSSTLEVSSSLNFYKLPLDVKRALEEKSRTVQNTKWINSQTKGFEQSRLTFFNNLQKDVKILFDASELFALQSEINWSPSYQEVIQALQNQNKDLSNSARDSVNRIFSSDVLRQEECEQLNILCSNLAMAEEKFQVFFSTHDAYFDDFQQYFQTKFLEFRGQIRYEDVDQVGKRLIFMKTLASNIHQFSAEINIKINETLVLFKSRQGENSAIARLGTVLSKDITGAGQSIMDECNIFKGYLLHRFNTLTQTHDSDYVLERLTGTNVETERLKDLYREFDSLYQRLLEANLRRNLDLTEICTKIRILVSDIESQNPDNIKWDPYDTVKIPKVLAHLFALWTFQNAEHYFEAHGQNDQRSFLLQPHPAQVISIFRLLGIGATTEVLENNLIQINTGEGKSITLAIAAATLALFGFEVSCACYSEYLSERDYNAFKALFDLLDLTDYIHYGTFDKLCEQTLNENGQVRDIVKGFILRGIRSVASMNSRAFRARILLCDEVDVFFSQKYYGELYRPIASIKDPTISALIDWIWQRKASVNRSQVYASVEYQNCLNRFSDWELLLRKQVIQLVTDVKSYSNHQYIVQNDRIGYRKNDSISFSISFGYQTLFAYYQEFERGKISEQTLNQQKSINVACGTFSYTEIPKEFSFIMGVTGTLKLSESEKTIVRDEYKICKETFAPSVFGANNLRFDKSRHVLIENKHDYYKAIFKEVERQGRSDNGLRAVFVFFESVDALTNCLQSAAFNTLRDSIKCLTEEANPQEKNLIIKRATIAGQITFFTNSFGRGTDFIVSDKNVSLNGGVHVIQTFFSEEASEEEQIKGRTARQGESGSFSLIILDESLKKFFDYSVDIERLKRGLEFYPNHQNHPDHNKQYETVYHLLAAKRELFAHSQQVKRQNTIQDAKEYHRKSIEFLNEMKNQNIDHVKNFIINNS